MAAISKPQAATLPKGKAGPVRTYTVPIGYAVTFRDGSKTVIDGPAFGRRR